MKRNLCFLMIILLLAAFSACGKTNIYYDNPPTAAPQQNKQAPAEPEQQATATPAHISPDLLPQDVDPAVFVGSYKGYYNNNSGEMQLEVFIYDAVMVDDEVYLYGEFAFEPGTGNTTGKAGMYKIEGTLDPVTGYAYMSGKNWISAQPAGYEMLDFYGYMYQDGYFAGDLLRDYHTFFEMIKVSDIA